MSRFTAWVVMLCTAVVALTIDQLTKAVLFPPHSPFSILGGLVQLTNHKNFGIAFDLPIPMIGIVIITLAIVLTLLILWLKQKPIHLLRTIALGLVVGGAIGNLYDRMALNFVRDWLLLGGRTAINLADVAIAVGLVLYVWERSIPPLTPPSLGGAPHGITSQEKK